MGCAADDALVIKSSCQQSVAGKSLASFAAETRRTGVIQQITGCPVDGRLIQAPFA